MIHFGHRNTMDLQYKYMNTYIWKPRKFKVENYLNTIYSKNRIIHEFGNVHALGIEDVLCLWVFQDCLGKLSLVLLSSIISDG
jgi:hypothetical protein